MFRLKNCSEINKTTYLIEKCNTLYMSRSQFIISIALYTTYFVIIHRSRRSLSLLYIIVHYILMIVLLDLLSIMTVELFPFQYTLLFI